MVSQIARRILKRYPITSTTCSALLGTCAYATYVEWQTEISERSYYYEDTIHERFPGEEDNTTLTKPKPIELPRKYDREAIEKYWTGRPVTVAIRVADIVKEATPIIWAYIRDFKLRLNSTTGGEEDPSLNALLQHAQAAKLREALTRLGPAFVKAGQQLSIRPDLAPPPVLAELQRLCDSVDPVADEVAMEVLRKELGCKDEQELFDLFEGIRLVASASLGQVYKAIIKETNETVAIKVQRPDMIRKVSLDLFLLQKIAKIMDGFTSTFTVQAPYHQDLVDTFAHGSYMELDYENEASNQIRFKSEFAKRKCKVYIPSVYPQFTSQRVITTEWINGVKLADAPRSQIRALIPVGVELFLTQLLDIGAFHADPHPGNLYVKDDGTLCLLDFGLCAEVDEQSRHAMTAAIVHLLTGDFDALVERDAKNLGFLPENLDTKELQPILTKILTEGLLESGSNLYTRKRKLMDISNELNEVFFRYPFSVPPFFALITRGLGLLEGIALSGDPNFDIFKASYPYARRRAIEIFGTHSLNQMRGRMTDNSRIGS